MENLKTKSIILLAGLVTGIFLGWTINGWWSGNRIAKLEKDHAEAVLKAEQYARKKEQAMQAEHDALARKHKLKSTGCAVAYVLALCACQSPPVAVQCPEIPPMTLEKREPNLTERLLTILSLSQPTETQQSGS